MTGVAIKGLSFHALLCNSCLDIVALKRVLLMSFFTFPIHHPFWLSLSMDLMGFLCSVATQGFIPMVVVVGMVVFVICCYMLLLCGACY
jgi:hypothetical protein